MKVPNAAPTALFFEWRERKVAHNVLTNVAVSRTCKRCNLRATLRAARGHASHPRRLIGKAPCHRQSAPEYSEQPPACRCECRMHSARSLVGGRRAFCILTAQEGTTMVLA